MMKRGIISIDDVICNGCGRCVEGCAEGAIQVVDGKARLVSEIFCDGLGACLGECPVGAIRIEEREAAPYNERETIKKLLVQGEKVVALHLEHLKSHGQQKYYEEGVETLKKLGFTVPEEGKVQLEQKTCECHHAAQKTLNQAVVANNSSNRRTELNGQVMSNWPIQLQLINPEFGVFDGADLVIAADCTAFSLPDFYKRFIKNRMLIVFCPKLDRSAEIYIEKLAGIFERHEVKSVTILRMIVPCCGGTEMIVNTAIGKSGKILDAVVYTINFDGTMV